MCILFEKWALPVLKCGAKMKSSPEALLEAFTESNMIGML